MAFWVFSPKIRRCCRVVTDLQWQISYVLIRQGRIDVSQPRSVLAHNPTLSPPCAKQGNGGAMPIFKFIRLKPPTIVDLVMIAIGLASLYIAYLQLISEGMAG